MSEIVNTRSGDGVERHGEDAGLIGRIPIVFGADDPLTTEKLSVAFSILGKELTAENLIRIFVERPDVVGGGNLVINVYEACKVDGVTDRYALTGKTITVAEATGVQVKADDIAGIGYGTGNIKIGADWAADFAAWTNASEDYKKGAIVTNDDVRYVCTADNISAAENEPGDIDIDDVSVWATATAYLQNAYVEVGSDRYKAKSNHTSSADDMPGAVTADEVPDWATATEYDADDYVENDAKYYRCIATHESAAGSEPGSVDIAVSVSEWATATPYTTGAYVEVDGQRYICLGNHTSSADDEPGVGVNTATYWEEVTLWDSYWIETAFWDTYWEAVDLWDEFWAEASDITVNVALYRR